LQEFVAHGGVLVTVGNTAEFATEYGLTSGIRVNDAPAGHVVGTVLRSVTVDTTSPIAYGVPDSLAVYSESGETFSVSDLKGGGFRSRFAHADSARATGRGSAEDPDVPQGRPALDARHAAETLPTVEPWQATPPTEEQLRRPVDVIPPDQRPRVVLRFSDRSALLVSGLLDGAGDLAQRPVVVDVPVAQGHIVMFATNPIYRGETIGSYGLVFNTMMNFDHLGADRVLDTK
jgi:hypothetical protein